MMRQHLHLDTANAVDDQRYSYLQTPAEMDPSRDDRIAVRPESDGPLQNRPLRHTSRSPPPPDQHPANFAPIVEDSTNPAYTYTSTTTYSQQQTPQPPTSPGPLPSKTQDPPLYQHTPFQNTKSRIPVAPDTNPLHLQTPRSPHFPPPTTRNISTTTRTSRAIPPTIDLDTTTYPFHQPGQISHPNQETQGGTWTHSLCECDCDSNCSDVFGTCCLGFICPCILYGRTQHRLSTKAKKGDPTNLLGYRVCNASCTAMALLCGCQWLLATIQHTRTRKAYAIPGDVVSDCVTAGCCCCCTLIQDEKEIKKREDVRARAAIAAGVRSPYLPPSQMVYSPHD